MVSAVGKVLRAAVGILVNPITKPSVEPRMRISFLPTMPFPNQASVISGVFQQFRKKRLSLQPGKCVGLPALFNPIVDAMLGGHSPSEKAGSRWRTNWRCRVRIRHADSFASDTLHIRSLYFGIAVGLL